MQEVNKTGEYIGCHIQSLCLSEESYCENSGVCEIGVLKNEYQAQCRFV